MEYGKILSIKEVDDVKYNEDSWSGFDGYEVQTDKTNIKVLISNGQSCCENWGYLTTNDDLQEFIEANINKIDVVDTALKKMDALEYMDEGSIMFVNFETDKGTLQLAAYNSHNGYYGHTARLIIGDEVKEEYL
jgi:tRNA(Ile2) C34 agmatinyltransferase TiaS